MKNKEKMSEIAQSKFNIFLGAGIAIAVFCVMLLMPFVQNFIIRIGEMIVGRALRDHVKWHRKIMQLGVLGIFADTLAILFYINPKHFFTEIIPANKERIKNIFCIAIPICVFAYMILPYILFGENCVITVWDYLDWIVGWYKLVKTNHYLFDLNSSMQILDGLSTVYMSGCGVNFTLLSFIHYFLPEVAALALGNALVILIGFFSMYALLKLIFGKEFKILLVIVSLIYSILPALPFYAFSAATVPLAILLFYYTATKKKKIYYLYAFLYPFICEFSATGIFICGMWLIALVVLSIRNKKLQMNLLFALVTMSVGFVLVNFRLFYMRFIINEPLNRDFLTTFTNPIDSFKMYCLHGQDHASSLHNKYILPITSFVFLFVVSSSLYNNLNKNISIMLVNSFKNLSAAAKTVVISFVFIFIFSVIATIDSAGLLRKFFSIVCPPLNGFSFARLHIFSRFLWYIAFFASFIFLWENSNFTKFVSLLILVLQFHLVLTTGVYNDSPASWKRNLEHGGKEKYITFKEFFSEKQFDEIKKYISYDGENVAAYGYHPSVLMYNGFNCIDGYLSVYPYRDMLKFRTLIEPTLEKNEVARKYYDSWGGRRYLYSIFDGVDGATYIHTPTREKHTEAIPLYINPDVFRDGYNGKYILSSYPISNADELGFELVKSFDSDGSIYIIYVYEIA